MLLQAFQDGRPAVVSRLQSAVVGLELQVALEAS